MEMRNYGELSYVDDIKKFVHPQNLSYFGPEDGLPQPQCFLKTEARSVGPQPLLAKTNQIRN